LSITGLPADYSPNQEITVTVTLNQSGRPRFGFELTALDSNGNKAGTLVVTDSSKTQLSNGEIPNRIYIEHTFGGTAPFAAGQGKWTFKWVAPASSVGKVTFYAAGNAANGDGGSGGDFIYTTSASISPPPPPPPPVVSVSAASYDGTTLASESITAAFAANMAPDVALATNVPLPTSLLGTSVKVKDSAGTERLAPLFFVSPGQTNYQVPPGTVKGTATVTVTNNNNVIAVGTVPIDTVAPGIFSANASGQGVAVGLALHFRNNQEILDEPLARFDTAQNKWVSVPIDLGPDTDLVFLVLYGTGIRFNSGLSNVSAKIGGVDAQVAYANVAPGLVGADQINIQVPRSLIGRGEINLVLTVDGKTSNTVTVNFR